MLVHVHKMFVRDSQDLKGSWQKVDEKFVICLTVNCKSIICWCKVGIKFVRISTRSLQAAHKRFVRTS